MELKYGINYGIKLWNKSMEGKYGINYGIEVWNKLWNKSME